jgi:hypothetical protein
VGVSSNIFGAGYLRSFVPSFQWGGASGFVSYQLDKAMETASRAMTRRNIALTEVEKDILKNVFEQTK